MPAILPVSEDLKASLIESVQHAINQLQSDDLRNLYSLLHKRLKVIETAERIKNQSNIDEEVRLDGASKLEVIEERAYLDHEWDPIFNLDKDRMIHSSIEADFETLSSKITNDPHSANITTPVLDYKWSKEHSPPDHIAFEFFRQFLKYVADYRFSHVSPDILLEGYKDYVREYGPSKLWPYLWDIDEFGAKLFDPKTGEYIEIDCSEYHKKEMEDWERQKRGEPKINRSKTFEEEDLYERVNRKYRL